MVRTWWIVHFSWFLECLVLIVEDFPRFQSLFLAGPIESPKLRPMQRDPAVNGTTPPCRAGTNRRGGMILFQSDSLTSFWAMDSIPVTGFPYEYQWTGKGDRLFEQGPLKRRQTCCFVSG